MVFFYEFCEIFKNDFYAENLWWLLQYAASLAKKKLRQRYKATWIVRV